jgi:head-tail adaptor
MAKTTLGQRNKLVLLQNPGPAVPDGEGGSTPSWIDLAPRSLYVSIAPATAKDLERVQGGTTISTNTYILEGAYHPQVTTQTRVLFGARLFSVTGAANPLEQNVDLVLVCVEVVP